MKLEELVKNGDFCVVGNSPDEIDKGNGSKIDSYSCVFRINNFQISSDFKKDYGEKTTVWAHTFCYDIDKREEGARPEKTVCPLPLDQWGVLERYHWTDVSWMKKDKRITEFVPNRFYHVLLESVVEPSTGIALLYWISRYSKIKKEQVFGFGFFGKGEVGDVTDHYWGKGKCTSHYGKEEYDLFKKLIS
jgi:hypothetical protein